MELGFHTPAFSPFGGASSQCQWRYWTEGWLRPRSTQATRPPTAPELHHGHGREDTAVADRAAPVPGG